MEALKISKIIEGGFAEEKGLRVDDVILSLDEVKVSTNIQFKETKSLAAELEKEEIKLTVKRRDKIYSLRIKPDEGLGVELEQVPINSVNKPEELSPPFISVLIYIVASLAFLGSFIIGMKQQIVEFKMVWIVAGFVELVLLCGVAAAITYLKGIYQNTLPKT